VPDVAVVAGVPAICGGVLTWPPGAGAVDAEESVAGASVSSPQAASKPQHQARSRQSRGRRKAIVIRDPKVGCALRVSDRTDEWLHRSSRTILFDVVHGRKLSPCDDDAVLTREHQEGNRVLLSWFGLRTICGVEIELSCYRYVVESLLLLLRKRRAGEGNVRRNMAANYVK
jgi:hypothetical protein